MTRLRQRFRCALLAFATAALPAQSVPTEVEVRTELAALDTAVQAKDADAYLRRFRPEQPFLHEQHERVLRGRLAAAPGLRRRTSLRSLSTFGEHAVAVVAQETFATGDAQPTMCEFVLLALRRFDDGVHPVLAAEVPEAEFDARSVVCPYCNYAVGPAEGWLALPMATSRTAAVEGTVFVRLGADLAVEVLVQLADRPQDAGAFVRPLQDALVAGARGSSATPVEPYVPSSFRPEDHGMTAARTRVHFGEDRVVALHAVAMGRLAHLLLVRGSRSAFEAHANDLDRLLASYRILSTEAKAHEQAAVAIDHHCGGLLVDTEYRNPRHGIVVEGPPAWTGIERCSGFLFEVDFSAPDTKARVRVRGLAPPPGAMHWDLAAADRWLADLCHRADTAVDATSDTGWLEAERGFRQRTLRLRDASGEARDVRLLLRPEQLVVADGRSHDGRHAATTRSAVQSLRPLR